MVSKENMYKPEEALKELQEQEQIVNALVDTQVCLQLLVRKGLATIEEVSKVRNTVRNSPRFKATIEAMEQYRQMFLKAKENPEEYLRAIMNAKLGR